MSFNYDQFLALAFYESSSKSSFHRMLRVVKQEMYA